MTLVLRGLVLLAIVAVACASHFTPPSTEEAVGKERLPRKALLAAKVIATKPKWGFFGTIFHLILEQVNETKSAYNQISDLVNNQFTDDAPTKRPSDASSEAPSNGTTESPKISRAEFLQILDRNLKGLRRLRDLEWREAWKVTGGVRLAVTVSYIVGLEHKPECCFRFYNTLYNYTTS